MNILIVGAKGQLGTTLTGILKAGKSEMGEISSLYQGAKVTLLSFPQIDITNYLDTMENLERLQPDLIINCAAFTDIDGCETDQEGAFKINAIGPRNLARGAQALGAKLVQVSSAYVFSGEQSTPYAEWDRENPQSIYGKTKWLGESYVREFSSRYYIVRTAWLYGYSGDNFVKDIMKRARQKGHLKIIDDNVGSPTNAIDLAHHILKIAATEEYGLYHCTGKGECSWFDFARKIVEFAGIPCIVHSCSADEFPRPAKRPAYCVLDNMMLRSTGLNEMRSWEDALKAFVAGVRR